VGGRSPEQIAGCRPTTRLDVYRNGSLLKAGIANDQAETDVIGSKGAGSYTYRICETDTSTCSNTVTVTF
jgi:thermitase